MQDFQTEIAHLRRVLRRDFGLRGNTRGDQVRYGGRLLPQEMRKALLRLAEAESMSTAPKLAKQVDWDQVPQDFAICRQYMQRRAQGRVQPLWLQVASWVALLVVMIIAGLIFLRSQI
jgi:hypothetical protein